MADETWGTRRPRRPELLVGLDRGLDDTGRIRREGDLGKVDPVFRPLVAQVADRVRAELGDRLHSLYLYGSVPRGAAVVGRSDLDVQVVLTTPVTERDRSRIASLSAELDAGTSVVDEVGILVDHRDELLSDAQRHDLAFHLSCLCTPLWGPDLGSELLEQRPTVALARGIGRGAEAGFAHLTAAMGSATERADLTRRRIGRRVARLAFATVMPSWQGWTSDPDTIHRVVTAYHPDREAELDRCVRIGWGHLVDPSGTAPPTTDAEALDLLRTSGQWWLAEHARVISGG